MSTWWVPLWWRLPRFERHMTCRLGVLEKAYKWGEHWPRFPSTNNIPIATIWVIVVDARRVHKIYKERTDGGVGHRIAADFQFPRFLPRLYHVTPWQLFRVPDGKPLSSSGFTNYCRTNRPFGMKATRIRLIGKQEILSSCASPQFLGSEDYSPMSLSSVPTPCHVWYIQS